VVAPLVLLVTYALIAGRRWKLLPIGRPSGALLGAVLMVALGGVTPSGAYALLDLPTLALLLGMLIIAAVLDQDGHMDTIVGLLVRGDPTPRALLVRLALVAAAGSAALMNDTVCLVLAPAIVRLCVRRGLPLTPYLLALATSSNLGSAATLIGNPQNMLIAGASGLSFLDFAARAGPGVLAALPVHLGLLLGVYGKDLPARMSPDAEPTTTRAPSARTLVLTVAGVVAMALGADLGWTALATATALLVARRQDPAPVLAKADWPVLLLFAGLFVVVGAARGSPELMGIIGTVAAPGAAGVLGWTGGLVVASNVVSNVPLVMLLAPGLAASHAAPSTWALLGFVTTVAGNLTLIGSVANLLVAEAAKAHHDLGFFEYLRFGALTTLVTLAVGVPAVLAMGWLLDG
jgi:Na+/H+ antiporter NhaD/arsenite permease-like protein